MKTRFWKNKRLTSMVIIFITALIISCNSKSVDTEKIKEEIVKTEHNFWKRSKEKGIAEAFLYYAAEEAVLSRGNKLIRGKEKIKEYFENKDIKKDSLEWATFFVDVAESGELAYTYGPYIYYSISEEGNTDTSEGFFHTVWKKQTDGSWKYVWD